MMRLRPFWKRKEEIGGVDEDDDDEPDHEHSEDDPDWPIEAEPAEHDETE
jgi:hypothetical protein